MTLKQEIEKLKQNEEFKNWHKDNPQYYLAHAFRIVEDSAEWQIGFSDGEKVVTFFSDPFRMSEAQDAYKKPDAKIPKLNDEEIKIDLGKALDAFNEIKEKKYSAEKLYKMVALVQTIEGKTVYNITGITMSMQTLNMRIDMQGNVIEDSLQGLVEQ